MSGPASMVWQLVTCIYEVPSKLLLFSLAFGVSSL